MFKDALRELDVSERSVMLALAWISVPFRGYPMEMPRSEVLSMSCLDDKSFNQVIKSLFRKGMISVNPMTGNFAIHALIQTAREEMWEDIWKLTGCIFNRR